MKWSTSRRSNLWGHHWTNVCLIFSFTHTHTHKSYEGSFLVLVIYESVYLQLPSKLSSILNAWIFKSDKRIGRSEREREREREKREQKLIGGKSLGCNWFSARIETRELECWDRYDNIEWHVLHLFLRLHIQCVSCVSWRGCVLYTDHNFSHGHEMRREDCRDSYARGLGHRMNDARFRRPLLEE